MNHGQSSVPVCAGQAERRVRFGLRAVWLALLGTGIVAGQSAAAEWQTGPGYRAQALTVPAAGKTGFTRLEPAATGITFGNYLPEERSVTNRILLSGSGVAAGDVDGDGRCDLYFCSLQGTNVLYRNLGHWKFEDVTAASGLAVPIPNSTGAVFADIDGDGDLDLLVTSLGGGLRIFENDGKGHFTEITDRAGVRSRTGGMGMALADVDGNGTLDLYQVNYRPTTIMDQPRTQFSLQYVGGVPVVAAVNGQPTTSPALTNRFVVGPARDVLELGEVDVLYLNDGHGRFTPVSFTGGQFLDEDGRPLREPPRDWGLSAQFHDLNGDGAPDLYVCNDLFSPDRIWINNGRGQFQAIAPLAVRHTSAFSMGVDFGDLDRDGHVDFMVADMLSRQHRNRQVQLAGMHPFFRQPGLFDDRPQVSQNTLQWNRGDGTFAEVAYYAGVEASEWSWAPIFLDVDLDGYEDILIVNGQLRDFQNMDAQRRIEAAERGQVVTGADMFRLMQSVPRFATPNLAFRNRGDRTFEEVSHAWGFDLDGISQGTALADLDNDGDLDVIVNNLNAPAAIFRNNTGAPRLAVRLRGRAPNTQGIGARITVTGGPVPQSQEVICGGRYLSGDDPMRVFAAGGVTNRLRIDVAWRSGRHSVVTNARPNWLYEIDETGAEAPPPPPAPAPKPCFVDVSDQLRHTHVDAPFNDFERQPLLPNQLSQLGPGVAWYDLDGDGWDDLVIGSGQGGPVAIFHNDGHGGFRQLSSPLNIQPVARDTTTLLGWTPSTGPAQLLVGSANYEDGQAAGSMVRVYDPAQGVIHDNFPGQRSSTGPLAMADVTGTGHLDLFVGGRVVPGRYPEAASSFLFRADQDQFKLDTANLATFANVGLVSGAVFSDLDGDGFPELILACEWGPIRIFRNVHGQFVEWNPPVHGQTFGAQRLTLHDLTGFWNGVTTGDLDGDGRMDIIASNWGLNSKYRANLEHPRRIYYGDIRGGGDVDVLEAVYDPELHQEVLDRDFETVASVLPFLRERFATYAAFAQASVGEVLGDRLDQARRLQATTFASMVFLNRGDHFEAVPLPAQAQFAPAFAVNVGDFDGDGNEDVFLSQNFFSTQPWTPRNDAGRGLWLRGDGHGGLQPVPGQASGIQVYGEQRGAALCDYDGDGRVDLVVTQNGAATRLYHNVGAKPGLRVRLKGPPGNPHGVGAVIRLRFGEATGPARELHAGSGYWSEDSLIQVMSLPKPVTGISVRWPGGKITTSAISPQAREIEVSDTGAVNQVR
ncbi:MAG: VCBS repeat-containing protein [Verrucomicrobia bacterium]|nr:VCBS repeat-containing protein [Verrucomicrobiota bacterium]